MRVIVCGSRGWTDRQVLYDRLKLLPPDTVIVHGAARGADTLAQIAAEKLSLQTEPHPADWSRHGNEAGRRRNIEMASAGADLCIAFWDESSRGTAHMMATARVFNIPTEIWTSTKEETHEQVG